MYLLTPPPPPWNLHILRRRTILIDPKIDIFPENDFVVFCNSKDLPEYVSLPSLDIL